MYVCMVRVYVSMYVHRMYVMYMVLKYCNGVLEGCIGSHVLM